MKLLKTVRNIIEENDLLRRGDGVIAGCSGGPDSMCLLHLLMQLKEPLELTIRVVHLEHGFRGAASEEDARYVEGFCQTHGIDCVIRRENVREQAKRAGISEETAGREARYRLFFAEKERLERELRTKSCPTEEPGPKVKIAVAHNKNDQAETILMRIMRGTGLEGLCGMELSRGDGIIRPLLTTDRSQIEAYCEEMGLCPRRDYTNEQADYTRNRIRLELIPYMKDYFNENVEDALLRLGRIASETQKMVRHQVKRIKETEGKSELSYGTDRRALIRLDDGLRHAVIRDILKELGLTANVSSVHLQRIDDLLKSRSASGSVDLPKGYSVGVSYDSVQWNSPSAGSADETSEGAVGRITVREELRSGGNGLSMIRELSGNIKCFDGDKIRAVLRCGEEPVSGDMLTVRFRKPGDVIRPLGSPGRKKLQDWFVDRKIPRQMRDRVPLVCIGSEVLWIVGHQISENYKVEEQTKRLIFVEFHQ